MKEIVRVDLENEMDLILANNRTMKLAELCGLSVTLQTAFATAVSEIARSAFAGSKHTLLKLGIFTLSSTKKHIAAFVCNSNSGSENLDAINFAKKLIHEVKVVQNGPLCDVQLFLELKLGGLITSEKIDLFIAYFRNQPPISPYDEIRRKNIQLLEISGKLKESENQNRHLTDTLPLMMFSANAEGKITYTNQWIKDYFGPSLIGSAPFEKQDLVHPDDYARLNKDWDNIFKYGNSHFTQGRLKHKSGDYLWHLISIAPVKNENDTVTLWSGFFVDINAQKLVEETLKDNVELKQARKDLVDYQTQLEGKISELNISNHELEQFAYIASHDLQEPLRKIVTFSSLLEERLKNLAEDDRNYFNKIVSSATRMTTLINDVLDWSRVTRTREDFSVIDLNVIVESVKSDYDLVLQERQALLKTSRLPIVKGNRFQMVQLFSNLISNSLKFCETNPVINITCRNLDVNEVEQNDKLDGSTNYAEITVSDNGIGFEQEYSEQIFKIFQRLHGRSKYSGTGIGLAICRRIVENHGGMISATGNPDHGATFRIIIPIHSVAYQRDILQGNGIRSESEKVI